MYEPIPFDRNLMSQVWFKKMPFEYKYLLFYVWLKCDKIGVLELDLEDFCSVFSNGFFIENDINIGEFLESVNNDGKERMFLIDSGRRLWFAPTVIFRNSNKQGKRWLNNSDRDAAIINALAQRETTRKWTIQTLKDPDSRLTINTELIERVAGYSVDNHGALQFAKGIAKAVGYDLKLRKELPEQMKADYGHICQYCGGVFNGYELEIDHIIPTSKGGPDKFINKIPACQDCNQKKGAKSVFLFMKEQEFEWTKGLQNAVDKLVKKKLLDYPSHFPYKKRNKKRFLKHYEVIHIHTAVSYTHLFFKIGWCSLWCSISNLDKSEDIKKCV